LHLPFAFNAVTANNVTGVVAIKKWGTGAINETDALVNLGEAIINMSQDIVADQLENDKYPSVKALFDYVEGSEAWRRKMRPLMQVPKLMRQKPTP
jgi:hypothetical protein